MEEPVQAPCQPVKVLGKAPQDDAKILRPARDPATPAIKDEQAQKNAEEPESCAPVPMPAGFEAAVGQGDQALKIRLQCWDCPGQQEYAVLNLLYFAQGIYVVVCDMSEDRREGQGIRLGGGFRLAGFSFKQQGFFEHHAAYTLGVNCEKACHQLTTAHGQAGWPSLPWLGTSKNTCRPRTCSKALA